MSNWGIQNHNPGNLRPNQPWENMTGEAGGFAVFLNPVWGFRAMFRNYIAYFDAGYNTITKLVNRWSPASDNTSAEDKDGSASVAAYIAALCKSTGFAADEVIALKTWDVASRLCYAQTIHECGQFAPAFTQSQMAQGAFRAGIVDAPPPLAKKLATQVAGYGSAVAGAATVVQPQIETISQQQHSHTIQILLGVTTVVLGIIAAVVKPKASSQ